MRFGAYGHLDDKLEFIENGVHLLLLLRFRCWSFYRSYPRKSSHHFLMGLLLFASFCYFYQDCVSPCCKLSNKLGFIEFGVCLQKLWQFWCSEKATAVLPRIRADVIFLLPLQSSTTAAPTAIVPLRTKNSSQVLRW